MEQQSSVEWLIDKVFDHTLHKDMGQIFTQARKMHKAEKMYSEEEVLKILVAHGNFLYNGEELTLSDWFEQFKK